MEDRKDGLIYAQIPKIMEAVGAIGKDRKNTMQNYSFRGIDDIYNALQPALVKYEVPVVHDGRTVYGTVPPKDKPKFGFIADEDEDKSPENGTGEKQAS